MKNIPFYIGFSSQKQSNADIIENNESRKYYENEFNEMLLIVAIEKKNTCHMQAINYKYIYTKQHNIHKTFTWLII